MMIMPSSYYSKETYEKMKKSYKLWLISAILIIFIGLLFFGLSAFLINNKTVLIIKIVDAIILSLALITGAIIIIVAYVPLKRRNKFLYRLLTVERFEGSLVIKEIRKPYLVRKSILAYEIVAVDDEDKTINCFYEANLPINFKVDDKVEVTLAANFIVDIKEANNE